MPLTSNELEIIVADVLNGNPPRITGPEADQFRRELDKDLKLARSKGWTVEIPGEILAGD